MIANTSGWAVMGARSMLASAMLDAYVIAETILWDHFPDVAGSGTRAMAVGGEPEPVVDKAAEEVR